MKWAYSHGVEHSRIGKGQPHGILNKVGTFRVWGRTQMDNRKQNAKVFEKDGRTIRKIVTPIMVSSTRFTQAWTFRVFIKLSYLARLSLKARSYPDSSSIVAFYEYCVRTRSVGPEYLQQHKSSELDNTVTEMREIQARSCLSYRLKCGRKKVTRQLATARQLHVKPTHHSPLHPTRGPSRSHASSSS